MASAHAEKTTKSLCRRRCISNQKHRKKPASGLKQAFLTHANLTLTRPAGIECIPTALPMRRENSQSLGVKVTVLEAKDRTRHNAGSSDDKTANAHLMVALAGSRTQSPVGKGICSTQAIYNIKAASTDRADKVERMAGATTIAKLFKHGTQAPVNVVAVPMNAISWPQ